MALRSHTPKGRLSRARILRVAERLLAERGFHGTSVRDVAEACDLPLASVVYHFARKETLHAAVLGQIAEQLLGAVRRSASPTPPSQRLEAAGAALIRWALLHPARVKLLLRELLDNPSRVFRAKALPLAPVLHTFVEAATAAGHPEPELAVLHLFGAVSYVIAARPTVRRIVGNDRDREMMDGYERTALHLARQLFDVTGARAAHVQPSD
jgi:AcrR family transcriptional regulator